MNLAGIQAVVMQEGALALPGARCNGTKAVERADVDLLVGVIPVVIVLNRLAEQPLGRARLVDRRTAERDACRLEVPILLLDRP
jgi:hypothetical protein